MRPTFNTYDTLRVVATFMEGATPVAPASVAVVTRTPAGVVSTIPHASLTRVASTAWRADIPLTEPGEWAVSVRALGPITAVDEFTITVDPPLIP